MHVGCLAKFLLYYSLPDVAPSDKHAIFLPFVASSCCPKMSQNILLLYSIKLDFVCLT